MRIVDRAEMPPAQCAITGDIDGPFIDTGSWAVHDIPTPDGWQLPRVYLHVPVVKQMARDLLGMVPEEDVQALREAVDHLSDLLEERNKELEAYRTIEEARKVVA